MRTFTLLFWLVIAFLWAADLAILVLNVVGVCILYYQGEVLAAVEMLGEETLHGEELTPVEPGLGGVDSVREEVSSEKEDRRMRPGRYDMRLGINGDAKESQEGSWIYDPDRMIQTGRSWGEDSGWGGALLVQADG